VSGEHAVVLTILDDSFLEDLRSTNGTLVNGAAVAKYFLRDRDEIDVGRHILIYCADDGGQGRTAAVRRLISERREATSVSPFRRRLSGTRHGCTVLMAGRRELRRRGDRGSSQRRNREFSGAEKCT
jgi:hypothetical protein